MNIDTTRRTADRPTMPWWRLPIVWLVIGGPAAVVAASFFTLALALARPDPVIGSGADGDASAQPAVQARNHAATPKLKP